jgi:transcriptional regulator with XRE-family HTH domain
VHFITISRLERGTQNVSVAVVWKLAHALDVDASDLLK